MDRHPSALREVPPSDPAGGVKKLSAMRKGLIPALCAGLLGVFLLLWGGDLFPSCARTKDTDGTVPSGETDLYGDIDAYRASLEARIARVVGEVNGAGDVTVMVMLDGGFRQVYAVEEKVGASGTSRSYVTIGSGNAKTALPVTVEFPSVVGIGIVCTGGSDPRVRQEITSLLSAAFSLGANKIYVTGK